MGVTSLNDIQIVYLSIFVMISILGCMYQGYHLILFYKQRKKQKYLKRYPNIVMFINITVMIHIGLYGSFFLISSAYGVKLPDYTQLSVHPAYVYAIIANLSYCFSGHGITLGFIGRTWLIFYNTKWKQETLVCKCVYVV